jgi:hypothetical protein
VSSLVREEFGPSLPELLAGRTGRPARTWRRVLIGGLVLVLLVALGARIVQREAAKKTGVVVTGGLFPFNLAYDEDRLERVDPLDGERLRLSSPEGAEVPMRFVVRERTLDAYTGDAAGYVPLLASTIADDMAREDPEFRLRGEARARINDNPGYQITYQTKIDGRTAYGKRYVLYDDPDDSEATLNKPTVVADVTLVSGRSPAIPRADAVGGNGALKTPLRSFRFGAQRP